MFNTELETRGGNFAGITFALAWLLTLFLTLAPRADAQTLDVVVTATRIPETAYRVPPLFQSCRGKNCATAVQRTWPLP